MSVCQVCKTRPGIPERDAPSDDESADARYHQLPLPKHDVCSTCLMVIFGYLCHRSKKTCPKCCGEHALKIYIEDGFFCHNCQEEVDTLKVATSNDKLWEEHRYAIRELLRRGVSIYDTFDWTFSQSQYCHQPTFLTKAATQVVVAGNYNVIIMRCAQLRKKYVDHDSIEELVQGRTVTGELSITVDESVEDESDNTRALVGKLRLDPQDFLLATHFSFEITSDIAGNNSASAQAGGERFRPVRLATEVLPAWQAASYGLGKNGKIIPVLEVQAENGCSYINPCVCFPLHAVVGAKVSDIGMRFCIVERAQSHGANIVDFRDTGGH